MCHNRLKFKNYMKNANTLSHFLFIYFIHYNSLYSHVFHLAEWQNILRISLLLYVLDCKITNINRKNSKQKWIVKISLSLEKILKYYFNVIVAYFHGKNVQRYILGAYTWSISKTSNIYMYKCIYINVDNSFLGFFVSLE